MVSSAYYGAVINPQERNPYEPISYNAWPRSLIAVSEDGRIVRVFPHVSESDITDILEREGLQNYDVVKFSPGEFIMPGFVDTHTVCLRCTQWRGRQLISDEFGSTRPNSLTLACKSSIFNGCAMPWTSNPLHAAARSTSFSNGFPKLCIQGKPNSLKTNMLKVSIRRSSNASSTLV